ncbi:UNKNOWN [Stylonychia lemnae]|uniref:Uncharacterized protein n=1 Tax=Stylonychia lemnae TaxID=5949 RepID=A0A078B404_STYLE|nr:UNKNOWN [Stylonychia lemnae]|eukprot:CDW88243.1 UNKNOWN [Stylonychia lemnae]
MSHSGQNTAKELPFTNKDYMNKYFRQTPQTSFERQILRQEMNLVLNNNLDSYQKFQQIKTENLNKIKIVNVNNIKHSIENVMRNWNKHESIKLKKSDVVNLDVKEFLRDKSKTKQRQDDQVEQQNLEQQSHQQATVTSKFMAKRQSLESQELNKEERDEDVLEVEKLDNWKKLDTTAKESKRSIQNLNKKFLITLMQKTDKVLNIQPEQLVKSNLANSNEILRAPSRQLQSIIKQKQQKDNGFNYQSIYDVTDGTDRLKDILQLKKARGNMEIILHQASKIQQKLTLHNQQQQNQIADDQSSIVDEQSPFGRQDRQDSNQMVSSPPPQNFSQASQQNRFESLRPQQTLKIPERQSSIDPGSASKISARLAMNRQGTNGGLVQRVQSQPILRNVNKQNKAKSYKSLRQGIDEEEESLDEYQVIKNLKNQRQTFSLFINGEQMAKQMKRLNEEIKRAENAHFQTIPLPKDLYLGFKEIALNYEISLELKSKQLQEFKAEKLKDFEDIQNIKKRLQYQIDSYKNLRQLLKNVPQTPVKDSSSIQPTPGSAVRKKTAIDFLGQKINQDLQKYAKQKRVIQDQEEKINAYDQLIKNLNMEMKIQVAKEKILLNEISYLDNEINIIIQTQMKHYHELLHTGLDYRQEGLSWIIKSIWLLGESVNLQKMPKWLDNKGIEFLLDYSRLQLDMTKKLSMVRQEQQGNKNNRQSGSILEQDYQLQPNLIVSQFDLNTKTPATEEKTSIHSLNRRQLLQDFQDKQNGFIERIKKKLKVLSNNLQRQQITEGLELGHNYFFMSLLDNDFNKQFIKDDSFIRYSEPDSINDSPMIKMKRQNYENKYKSILTLEQEINFLKEQIKNLREKEISRIFKEFLQCNYEKTNKVTIEVVLCALVGYQRAQKVLQKLRAKSDQLKKNFEMTKTFQFGSMRSGLGNLLLLDPSLKIL